MGGHGDNGRWGRDGGTRGQAQGGGDGPRGGDTAGTGRSSVCVPPSPTPAPAPAPLTAVLRRRAGPEPGVRRSRQRSARQAAIAAIFAEGRGFGAGEGPPSGGVVKRREACVSA